MTSSRNALALACLFVMVWSAWSQTEATVSGTVSDPSGAHVVGAIVTAANGATGVVSSTRTNEAGVYVFPSLPPGKYRFTAEQSGFRQAVIRDIDLEVGSQLTINMALELGQTSESVEVQATASLLNTSTATVGDVVNGKKLLDLPLAGRSAYDLLNTQPGVISAYGTSTATRNYILNGNRGGSVNFTMDGINAQNNLLSGAFYLYSNVVSVDRAEEFRVVTSPADAEYGRGSGQVQMITRSGSNAFHGSAFFEHRNTDFNANTWINNSLGNDPVTGAQISPRDILIQNNYGVRLGGPVKRNKTFFNGIYEPYKQRQTLVFTGTVFTPSARNGSFRFFPGVLNGNAQAAVPTVDLQGNPVQPAGATGALQSVSLYGRDPNRLVADPTGAVAHALSYLPLPNNYRVGDGLNTAGYTWNRPVPVNFELYEGRIDHFFNDKHRIAIVLNQQSFHSFNVATPPPFPAVPGNVNPTETTQYSIALTSVLRPNLLNDLRVGVFRPRTLVLTPFDKNQPGSSGLLSTNNGVPFVLCFAGSTTTCGQGTNITNPVTGNQSNYIAPVYQYGDSVTWVKGRHSFKSGAEVRLISDSGYDANFVTPRVYLGQNALLPVTNISTGSNPIPGIGSNATAAQNVLLTLAGTVQFANQTNNSPGGKNPAFLPGETRFREWHQNEFSWYLKDDFKVTPSLTLNLGVRYELYLAPREGQGKMITPAGGGAGAFGISGTNFTNGEFQPGVLNGSTTRVINIGAGTANPDVPLYQTDRNNFAPAVGLSWSLPWFGKDKTVIRAGYGIGYERLPIYLTHNNAGLEPGLSESTTTFAFTNLSNVTLPIPASGLPLAEVPLTGAGSHTQTLFAFDNNLRTPYSQNYNFSVQRALSSTTSLRLSYVGSKGSKLARSIDVNEVNIFENGLLDGFKIVQAGGDSPLIDKIFAPLAGATGGSNFVRTNSATQAFFATNNPGGFANYISTTTALGNIAGNLLKTAGLPLNFVVANPQYLSSYLVGNFSNSSYNSLQIELNYRPNSGLTLQGSYVWSKALGDDEGDSSTLQASYRTLRNRSLDKRLLSFNRGQVGKVNAIYELPIGHGKLIGRTATGFVDRMIGGWQIGGIFYYFGGAPWTITGQNTVNNYTLSNDLEQFTPMLVGKLPSSGLSKLPDGAALVTGFTQVTDPSVANLTGSLRALSTLKAIAVGGSPVLVNAPPGQFGTLPLAVMTGPDQVQVDANIIKHVRLNERFTLQFGATARNLTNTPAFANPTVGNSSINSVNFGRITTMAIGTVPRIIVLQGRISF
jgi:hypothetical protein